ncbi:MAG: sodium-dependent bicarbonate transport family permease [Actinomycetes bacterium]
MDALATLSSPVVLAFLLGLSAALLKSDLRLPEQVHGFLSLYLLLAIGLKGGVGLRDADLGDLVLPVVVTLVLGVVTPLIAFGTLRRLTRLDRTDRAALAAHYGSTSLVTFTAAVAALDAARVEMEGYLATLLAVLEVPGIIVGLLLAGRVAAGGNRSSALREVLTGKSVLLLIGGLTIGAITGASGYVAVEPFFGGLFQGVLVLFLLDLGVMAGQRLRDLPQAGTGLVVAAIVLPLVNGSLGVLGGTAAGLSTGGAAILGVLAASASYIAAPAAVRLALPSANPAYYLTSSLGITFPFNLVIGIPLFLAMSRALS